MAPEGSRKNQMDGNLVIVFQTDIWDGLHVTCELLELIMRCVLKHDIHLSNVLPANVFQTRWTVAGWLVAGCLADWLAGCLAAWLAWLAS